MSFNGIIATKPFQLIVKKYSLSSSRFSRMDIEFGGISPRWLFITHLCSSVLFLRVAISTRVPLVNYLCYRKRKINLCLFSSSELPPSVSCLCVKFLTRIFPRLPVGCTCYLTFSTSLGWVRCRITFLLYTLMFYFNLYWNTLCSIYTT